MRGKGISYDTGFVFNGAVSPDCFDLEVVGRELRIIRDDLHCNAVRVIGGDPERLELAAARAADLGLEVWFSPYPLELITEAGARVNEFLGQAVTLVRKRFGGRITYAAVPFERVDWAPFDIVSADLYRSAAIAGQFRAGVRTLVAQGKPVAMTEFGAATYRGAADRGAQGLEIVEYDPDTRAPVRLDGEYARDEAGQAAYLRELLETFDAEGVDSAFVFAFAVHGFPHRPGGDPRDDLDLASYGVVKLLDGRHGQTYPDMTWEPKAAFTAVADCYRPG
jgi:hypothetical protein